MERIFESIVIFVIFGIFLLIITLKPTKKAKFCDLYIKVPPKEKFAVYTPGAYISENDAQVLKCALWQHLLATGTCANCKSPHLLQQIKTDLSFFIVCTKCQTQFWASPFVENGAYFITPENEVKKYEFI